jgi:transposase
MARGYRSADRAQGFLLPPDVREWLPPGHLAWLVIDLVAAADTAAFHAGRRTGGRGRAGFDPEVLLALLIYGYATGTRSSRRLEQRCETDVACRVITGNQVPDHTVIARFRQAHDAALVGLFSQVLAVCAAEGMGRVGVVAVDGTKIAADASRLGNRTREQLAAEAAAIIAEADAVDAAEDSEWGEGRGDELPGGLRPGSGRLARLQACLADLDAAHPDPPRVDAARRRVVVNQTRLDRDLAQRRAYEAQRDAGTRPAGAPPPVRPAEIKRTRQRLAAAQADLQQALAQPLATPHGQPPRRNPSDPDSRLVRCQGGWMQGYNAQAAVSADGLIMACEATTNAADTPTFVPMLSQLAEQLTAAGISDPVRAVLADAGYHSRRNLTAPGPPRLIPPHRTDRNPDSQRMRRLLDQPAMARLYQRRCRVETTFGRIKHNQGFRRFSRRGLPATNAEWHLVCLTHNLLALHHHRRHQPPTT